MKKSISNPNVATQKESGFTTRKEIRDREREDFNTHLENLKTKRLLKSFWSRK